MSDTILNIALVVVLALFVLYTVRNSRKNKAKQAALRDQIVPGAEVMTNFGLFGTLVSIDEVRNTAELEVSPGQIVRVHRQTIAKVVTETEVAEGEPRSVEEAMEIANREAELKEKAAGETPAYGERTEQPVEPAAEAIEEPVKKPARRTSKKVDE